MSFWGWFLVGAGSWVLAVVLKVLADFIVQRTVTVALRDWAASVLSGLWSSLCEIGLAALAFWYWGASFADALVLATGAALAELFALWAGALIAVQDKKKESKAKGASNWSAFFGERAVAVGSHLASRALAWLGIGGPGGLAALASAFAFFALTEGIQAYGQAKEWDWLNRRILWTYLFFQAAVIVAEIALIVAWWRAA
jgi:hypothetical protein